jgi:DNA repair protein RadC
LSPKRATKAIPREEGPPSDAELLAALIADGAEDALPLAKTLILKWGDLFSLPATTREMLRHDGLAEGQASRLLAAAELARRLAREEVPLRRPLSRRHEVARYLALRYARRDQEIMGAVFLDTRHRFLSDAELYRGTIRHARVEPREILRESLLRGAASVILFHTHPSGDPTPSREDLDFTMRIAYAASVVGVDLVDHLVLGSPGRYVSLKERGVW